MTEGVPLEIKVTFLQGGRGDPSPTVFGAKILFVRCHTATKLTQSSSKKQNGEEITPRLDLKLKKHY